MTQEHPITPPPELVQEWIKDADHNKPMFAQVAVTAARWGADQELKACRLWVSENCDIYSAVELIQFRRPKPPSLKEQALEQLECIDEILRKHGVINTETIRRALEQIND